MPFSLRLPRFLRFGRSRSRPPKSTADACDDGGISSAGLDISQAFSTRPTPGPSEQDVDAAPRVARLSASGNPIGSTDSLNRAPVDFAGQLSSASRPVTPTVPIISPHDSVVQPGIQLTPPSDDTQSGQAQRYLAPPRSPYGLATSSQQSFHAETTTPPAGPDSSQPPQQKGMFENAHNFSMTNPTFVDGNGNVTINNTIASKFMEKLLKETIPGAASDSSARDPPPQCHPGTRLAILERCIHFVTNCTGKQKIRWVVGFAGVGKSAIMQSVADSPNLRVTCHVSIFFSINGRNDGTKAIITLSYQLAAKSAPYRQFIECDIARDPSLLRSSMRVQFEKLIINPFIQNPQLSSAHRIVFIIDGLDECSDKTTQLELLRLISDFCITYPSSPLVWLIASRPEPHITSFFSKVNVMPAYEKEEIPVNSDEGRADVERFLRKKLKGIKEASHSLDPHKEWPEERDLWKLANASGGLFAYADIVTSYIDDEDVGNPVLQLSEVLKVIDNLPMTGIPREEHPMALLDALYARILSKVPAKVIKHTRKLVLALALRWDLALIGTRGSYDRATFVTLCNWLAITPDEAYAAINQLQSLLRTPKRDQAHLEYLEPFHKSFIDYVSDSSRSNFFTDMRHDDLQLKAECALRVLKEAPDGIDFGDVDYKILYGTLRRGPGPDTGDNISLTWPVDGNARYLRLTVFKMAVVTVVKGFTNRDSRFTSEFCVRILISQFASYEDDFELVLDLQVLDESRRHEFMRCGILKQMPLEAFTPIFTFRGLYIKLWFRRPAQAVTPDISSVPRGVKSLFHRPARAVVSLSDPWELSCQHEREGEWDKGKGQDWKTYFNTYGCRFCNFRFEDHLKARFPGHTVTLLFTYTGKCCVELRFVDPDDGISEWTYWTWITLSPEERKEYGSTV